MKISEHWLREWVDPAVDTHTLGEQLTMAGLEVDSITPAGPVLDQVYVGRIQATQPHPRADRLQICDVDVGAQGEFRIVCGADNAAKGLLAPVALAGAVLPGEMVIAETEVRGEPSQGMLCAAVELGLGEDAGGLLLLDDEAVPGTALSAHLGLEDNIIEIDLTPNRGDCLSVRGVAREVAVSNELQMRPPVADAVAAESDGRVTVNVVADKQCPAYAGRVIQGVNPKARTPDWLRERLRRSGVRPVSAIVDVTNYVMLELGQPLHAFDRNRLSGDIQVRLSDGGESILLLDGTDLRLQAGSLVIADASGPIALAGIMGGEATAVDDDTQDVFLESAYFTPAAVAGQGRRYKRHTDALHRFERGVDPALQRMAAERASRLLVDIAGGRPGPVIVAGAENSVAASPVSLRLARINRLLGCEIAVDEIVAILERLGMQVMPDGENQWQVIPPSYRFDIAAEADLIEEVARIHGYNRLPERAQTVPPDLGGKPETRLPADRVREVLIQRGYHEAITYSFVDPRTQALLQPQALAIDLDNPISEQYAQMRTTLWSGLLPVWQHNARRQQTRVRLFEIGLRFERDERAEMGIAQTPMLAGLLAGHAHPEHWDLSQQRRVDFFDAKGDVEALLALGGKGDAYHFEAVDHPALHPGRSAKITQGGYLAGYVGELHPAIGKKLKYKEMPLLFEVKYELLASARLPRYEGLSEFPWVRRDLAIVVPETVSAGKLQAVLESADEPILNSVRIFDVFHGGNLEKGFKSVALGLIFLNKSSTLEDEGVDAIVSRLEALLAQQCGASVRGQ